MMADMIQLPTVDGPPSPKDALKDSWKDPSGAAAQAGSDVAEMGAQLGTAINSAVEENRRIQADKLRNATQTAAQQDQIDSNIKANVEPLLQRAGVVFAKKAAVNQRATEVAQMNPLKRGILGLFNREYSPDYLKSLDGTLDDEAKGIASEYETKTALNHELYNIATHHGTSQEAILNTEESGMNSQISILSTQTQAARARLNDASSSLQVQKQLEETAISSLDSAGINNALGQAQKNGGYAVVNGVKLSQGALHDRSVQLQDQAMALESHQLSLAAGKMDLAAATQRHVIDTMSPGDIANAAQHDGMFHGTRLSMSALAGRMQNDSMITAGNIDNASIAGQAGQFKGIVKSWHDLQVNAINKTAETNGGTKVPTQINTFMNARNARVQAMADSLNAATGKAKTTLMATYAKEVAGWAPELDDTLNKAASKITGNKDSQRLLVSYWNGDPPDSATAVSGMIGLLRGNGNIPGSHVGGQFSNSFAAAKQALGALQASPDYQKMKPEDRRQAEINVVGGAMARTAVNTQGQLIIQSTPKWAKALGHPFGRVNDHDWQAAVSGGDADGLKKVAAKYGLTEDDLTAITKGGGAAAYEKLHKSLADKTPTPTQLGSELATTQTSSLMKMLDNGPAAHDGFVPSRAFSDLMKDDRYHATVDKFLSLQGQRGFPGFVNDAVAGGTTRGQHFTYAQTVNTVQAANEAERVRAITDVNSNYEHPYARTEAVLAGMPGFDSHSAQVLTAAIRQANQGRNSEVPGYQGISANDQISHIVKNTKFQNPELEKMRQNAAKYWDDHGGRLDKSIAALWRGYGNTQVGK